MIFVGLIVTFLSIADSKTCKENDFRKYTKEQREISSDSFFIPWCNETNENNAFCACQDLYHKAYYQETVYNLHKLKIINHCPSVLPLKEVALYIQFRSDFTAKTETNGKSLDSFCNKFQSEYLDSLIFTNLKIERYNM